MYCERKHIGKKVEWELIIKVFKNKTAINFRDFYIAILALNYNFDSLDNRFCNYLTNKMVYYERTKIEYPILSN